MTIKEIYENAERRLDRNEITIGEFSKLVEIEVEPVRHGRWEICVTDFFGGEDVKCSVCGEFENLPSWNYCPKCGARMDGAE